MRLPLFVVLVALSFPAACFADTESELAAINAQIQQCYKTHDGQRADSLFKQSINLIHQSGDMDAELQARTSHILMLNHFGMTDQAIEAIGRGEKLHGYADSKEFQAAKAKAMQQANLMKTMSEQPMTFAPLPPLQSGRHIPLVDNGLARHEAYQPGKTEAEGRAWADQNKQAIATFQENVQRRRAAERQAAADNSLRSTIQRSGVNIYKITTPSQRRALGF